MKFWKIHVVTIIGILLVAFLCFTIALGEVGQREASNVVNEGCAAHEGVKDWGGYRSYSATCRDGYAFTGDTGEYFDWPWW